MISEIVKATRIKEAYERHDKDGRGAFELDGAMIDAPVYKQVRHSSVVIFGG